MLNLIKLHTTPVYASFGSFGSSSPVSACLRLYDVCFAQHLANKGMCNNKQAAAHPHICIMHAFIRILEASTSQHICALQHLLDAYESFQVPSQTGEACTWLFGASLASTFAETMS